MVQIGPKVSVLLSCFSCVHVKADKYVCQGDSGYDISCGLVKREIGSSWNTPDWCPLRAQALSNFALGVVEPKAG
jgi:hypothetical protein